MAFGSRSMSGELMKTLKTAYNTLEHLMELFRLYRNCFFENKVPEHFVNISRLNR
jgi:hypothetical protein